MVLSETRYAQAVGHGETDIQALKGAVAGQVLTAGHSEYEEARKIHNGMIDRRPAVIVRVAETQDVVLAIEFARRFGLILAVRGGGHSVAGHSMCDGGLLIDFALMKGVEVDVERRIAKAQAGLRLGEYVTATEQYGLVTPTGTASDTGLAGLALGGGYGWLSGKYGMTIDNIVAMEVVTADGQVLRASEDEHPDLFWALRGGSGNFGVVTSFELKLYPVTEVLGGLLVYPFEQAREVLRHYRQVASSAPDELTTYSILATMPDGFKVIMIGVCYTGSMEEGERVLAPIREFGPPIADMVRVMPYSEINTLIDEANPSGMLNYWKWNGIKGVTNEAIETIVEYFERVPSPYSAVLIDQLHGVAARVSPDATAFAHRDAPHGLVVLSMWVDPEQSEVNMTWTREFSKASEPFSTGGLYVNGGLGKPEAAYGTNYARLASIKAKYDPDNLFSHNQNIKPAS